MQGPCVSSITYTEGSVGSSHNCQAIDVFLHCQPVRALDCDRRHLHDPSAVDRCSAEERKVVNEMRLELCPYFADTSTGDERVVTGQ